MLCRKVLSNLRHSTTTLVKLPSSPLRPTETMPDKKKTKQRTYLTEEEKRVLGPLVEEWSKKADKKSRDAFVSAEALPKIQALNLSRYGPDIISKDKAAKELWDKRIQVRVDEKQASRTCLADIYMTFAGRFHLVQ